MSFSLKRSKSKASASPAKPLKKYDYRSYLETQTPSDMAMNTAAKYGDKVASSAALQADIEANSATKMSMKGQKRARVCSFTRIMFVLLCLLQMCGAAGAIIITAVWLDTTVTGADGATSKAYCYLLNSSVNTCTYTYWAAGISIGVSLLLMMLNLACAGKRGNCCLSIETILAICGFIWWIGAGTVSVITSDNASDQGLGEESKRLALWIICYVTSGLFAGTFLISCSGCCCSCCRDTKDDFEY
jgi:hypothetical protein